MKKGIGGRWAPGAWYTRRDGKTARFEEVLGSSAVFYHPDIQACKFHEIDGSTDLTPKDMDIVEEEESLYIEKASTSPLLKKIRTFLGLE